MMTPPPLDRRRFLAALGALAACARLDRPAARPGEAHAFHAARRFATTPHGRIAYVERGAGPGALFLHGFPLNGFQWRGALDPARAWALAAINLDNRATFRAWRLAVTAARAASRPLAPLLARPPTSL